MALYIVRVSKKYETVLETDKKNLGTELEAVMKEFDRTSEIIEITPTCHCFTGEACPYDTTCSECPDKE